MYALYSVYATFAATTARSGAAPLEVGFEISSDAEVSGAHWQFGDGEEGDAFPTAAHTYERSGQFSVSAVMQLVDPVCGEVSYTQTEVAYVTACTAPIPEEGADGYFQIEPVSGLTWQTVNHTDVSTYGCVDTINWEVYKGGEVNADNLIQSVGAWSPAIAFPGAGTYTVLMNVGGPGGIKASALTVDVVDLGSQEALCSGAPGAVSLVAAAAGLVAGLRRRRG
jgi:PKD repeat protein